MEWEAKLIEWLQTSLSSAADFSKYFDFFGTETGLLLLILIVMFLLRLFSRYASCPLCGKSPSGKRPCNHGGRLAGSG